MSYKITKYPDDASYVELEKYESSFEFKLNSYEDLWTLNQLHDIYHYNKVKATVTIPNLIDAQADRRFNIDHSAGLHLVLKFLKGLTNFNYIIYHPHNQEVVEEALSNRVMILPPDNFLNQVTFDLHLGGKQPLILAPDAGAYKWVAKSMTAIGYQGDIYSASKIRQKSQLSQIVPLTDFKGQDILIVDDICVYGGTFLGLANLLKDCNVGKLYLAVSHMTVPEPNPSLFSVFDTVYTTNSKGWNYPALPHKDHGGGTTPTNLTIFKYNG